MKAAATSMSPTAAIAPRSYRLLVIEDKSSSQRREHDEQYVQVDEETRGLIGPGPARAHRALHRLPADDDERNPEWKRQQRQQQLARANARDHRGENAAEDRHSDGGE